MDKERQKVPAPGIYEIEKSTRGSRCAFSFSLLPKEGVSTNEKPGPGFYDIPGDFTSPTHAYTKLTKKIQKKIVF